MSNTSGVFETVLNRTSTPRPDEKVLLYLEGIARSGGASPLRDSVALSSTSYPDRSTWGPERLANISGEHRPPSRNSRVGHPVVIPVERYDDAQGDDFDSNAQERSEGQRSVIDDPHHEPGPNDGPGPRYESYGSSFGNLGPLPGTPGAPAWTQQQPPAGQPPWISPKTNTGVSQYQTPSQAKSPTLRRSAMSPTRTNDFNLPGLGLTLTGGVELLKSPTQRSKVGSPDIKPVPAPGNAFIIAAREALRSPSQRTRAMSPPRSAATLTAGGEAWGSFAAVGAPQATYDTIKSPTQKSAAALSSEVGIDVQAPSDATPAVSVLSRSVSRQSDRTQGAAQNTNNVGSVKSPQPAVAPQLPPGISISIGADGTTTIHVPTPMNAASQAASIANTGSPPPSAPKAPTERAPSVVNEVPASNPLSPALDKSPPSVASPRVRSVLSHKDAGFEAGYREDGNPLSPGVQRSSLGGSRAPPSKVGSRVPTELRPGGRPSSQLSKVLSAAGSVLSRERGTPGKAPSVISLAPSDSPSQAPSKRAREATVGGHDDDVGSNQGTERGGANQRPVSLVDGEDGEMRRSAVGSITSHRSSHAPPHRAASQTPSSVVSVDASKMMHNQAMSSTQSHPTRRPPRQHASSSKYEPRSYSPEFEELDDRETEIVRDYLRRRAPGNRSSMAPTVYTADLKHSHFHDQELCILLHAADDEMSHDVVKRAVVKAAKSRVKSLGMKYDTASIREYKRNFHNHDPSWHERNHPDFSPENPPPWVQDMMDKLSHMEATVAALGPQLEQLKTLKSQRSQSRRELSEILEDDGDAATPRNMPRSLGPQQTGDESFGYGVGTDYPPESLGGPATMPGSLHHRDGSTSRSQNHGHDEFEDDETHPGRGMGTYSSRRTPTDGDFRRRFVNDRQDSPGQQYLEEELYKLRVRQPSPGGSQATHRSWEIAREAPNHIGHETYEHDDGHVGESEMPEIEDPVLEDRRTPSPQLPPIHAEESREVGAPEDRAQWQVTQPGQPPRPPPWQLIHQRLLNWAIVWPISELDTALSSTLAGQQVDEVALSIWSAQMYKRYVRQQLTEVPPGRVDRLFVPPNMADAINNAVFHGRHGDACGMLRDLWGPFGLEGIPRIIVVLCKHRSDAGHWVAHKFSLPDGTLTTYDTYPDKCLPDGRPLGWWFAIRIAWPGAMYPNPDHLMQKMVRLHRPMQHQLNNSVAAAGIWRNLLMGSRAERPVDLERLRDLINTEVKNLRQRKEQGKLTVSSTNKPNWTWDEIAG